MQLFLPVQLDITELATMNRVVGTPMENGYINAIATRKGLMELGVLKAGTLDYYSTCHDVVVI